MSEIEREKYIEELSKSMTEALRVAFVEKKEVVIPEIRGRGSFSVFQTKDKNANNDGLFVNEKEGVFLKIRSGKSRGDNNTEIGLLHKSTEALMDLEYNYDHCKKCLRGYALVLDNNRYMMAHISKDYGLSVRAMLVKLVAGGDVPVLRRYLVGMMFAVARLCITAFYCKVYFKDREPKNFALEKVEGDVIVENEYHLRVLDEEVVMVETPDKEVKKELRMFYLTLVQNAMELIPNNILGKCRILDFRMKFADAFCALFKDVNDETLQTFKNESVHFDDNTNDDD